MKWMIFRSPREITKQEAYVIEKLNQYPNVMTEELLVSFYSTITNPLCERDIREIIGMYNKRKYLNTDNRVKYHKHNGHYQRIEKGSVGASKELYTKKLTMIAGLKDYKIYLEDFGSFEDDADALQLSFIDVLLNSVEEVNEDE